MDVAITQYEALKSFLETHLTNENSDNSRVGAKEKLNKLTQVQFYELSTDVYDELTRRVMNSNEVPFLAVRDEFHPKRNQARQKLATLPMTRFKDLAADIFYELERRHPELKDMKKPTSRPGASFTDNSIENNPKPYAINGNGIHSNIPIPDSMPPEYGVQKVPRSRSQSSASSSSDIGNHYMSMGSVTSISSKGTRDTVNSQKVNFESLDNLMADLGDIIGHKKMNSVERLKSDYELQLLALKKRVNELESELMGSGNSNGNSRVNSLENQLEELRKINEQQKQEIIRLEEERQQQLEITNDVKKEATSLIEEIKILSIKNEELSSEKESLTRTIDEWKSKYEKAMAEMKSLNETSFHKEVNHIDVSMLKDYLEHQTESIVQAIQTLLSSIRNGSYSNELPENITNIVTIVVSVISTCQDFLETSPGALYRSRGDPILKDLENGVNKLGEMRETITNDGENFMSNRASKQRLASASFDVAKFTKELVGLFE
ncbi:28698_t:CDS:2 [Dentiscutata erythropus]|uniref:28698_t:CDS:1 n=1 Tax=Dentiscutata erythropus TaxID=1348616 RepID=A0A9N9NK73_9GLOM|nr:28698_t:CDS:2 [Dentiscutata erythropus]